MTIPGARKHSQRGNGEQIGKERLGRVRCGIGKGDLGHVEWVWRMRQITYTRPPSSLDPVSAPRSQADTREELTIEVLFDPFVNQHWREGFSTEPATRDGALLVGFVVWRVGQGSTLGTDNLKT